MSDLRIQKDRKGKCYILSHKRCGVTECLFLTEDELIALKYMLNE